MLISDVSFVTWIISFLIIRAISRYREYSADRGAAQMTRKPKTCQCFAKISGNMSGAPVRDLRHFEGYNTLIIIPAILRGSLFNLFSTRPLVEKRDSKTHRYGEIDRASREIKQITCDNHIVSFFTSQIKLW
jgi:heat shock protein HtpX